MFDLVVQGSFDADALHRHYVESDDEAQALIDLRDAGFVTPAGAIATCLFVERAARAGREITFLAPRDSGGANYLSRIRLASVLDEFSARHDLPVVREHHVGDSLLELQVFDSAESADSLSRHIYDHVAPISHEAAKVLYKSLAATGENVGSHSGQQRGYLMAQKTHGGRKLWFAVGDAGRGFKKSLASRGATNDESALSLALQPGISALKDSARGYGLHEMLANIRAVNGRLALTSGHATRIEYGNGHVNSGSSQGRLKGCVLEGMIPLPQS